MKLGKAIRLVLARWNTSPYRLAKASGVGQATIGKLIKGEIESSTWDVVERLADGFGKIDPMAKAAFLGVLSMRDSTYSDLRVGHINFFDEMERPESINRVIEASKKLGLIDQEACKKLADQTGMIVEMQISIQMQTMRREEPDADA